MRPSRYMPGCLRFAPSALCRHYRLGRALFVKRLPLAIAHKQEVHEIPHQHVAHTALLALDSGMLKCSPGGRSAPEGHMYPMQVPSSDCRARWASYHKCRMRGVCVCWHPLHYEADGGQDKGVTPMYWLPRVAHACCRCGHVGPALSPSMFSGSSALPPTPCSMRLHPWRHWFRSVNSHYPGMDGAMPVRCQEPELIR